MKKIENPLVINAKLLKNGFRIQVNGKKYDTLFPVGIWENVPMTMRQILLDHLVYGFTHYIPLLLGNKKIVYNTKLPLFEPFIFKNMLYDLFSCEEPCGVEPLSFLRMFFNLEYEFASGSNSLPFSREYNQPSAINDTAILPFTFGKESLLTCALCQEIGITPILMYCGEPRQPYEEKYKRNVLREFKEKYNIQTFFVKNEVGLFRDGVALDMEVNELGWGTQTTLLMLLALPFVFTSGARYILMGNEHANNEWEWSNDWKMYLAYDQSSQWVTQLNNMIRILTNCQCDFKSSLEPIEEIQVFSILHHRYPELGKYQFSCSAEKPLHKGSQWCHQCYKCARMFLFARCTDVDPYTIGFQEDLLNKPDMFDHYFGDKFETGSTLELDFSFYTLLKKGEVSRYVSRFANEKAPKLKSWAWHRKMFTTLKEAPNLPQKYKRSLWNIFTNELQRFSSILPH